MQIKLGLRLQCIADLVPQGAVLADIGSDHGYLPAYLLQTGHIKRAIAGELTSDPATRARTTAKLVGLSSCQMEVREGDGLAILRPGEADTVVIAGMGGTTIVEILQSNPAVLTKIKRLILQPNIGGSLVRCWLAENGWSICDEALVMENEIIYEIIIAEAGTMQQLTDLQAEFGPILLDRRPAHFAARINAAIEARQYVAKQLLRSLDPVAKNKRTQVLQQIARLQKLLVN